MTSDAKIARDETDQASGDKGGARAKSGERGVLCAKCNHVNPPGRTLCNRCGSHLFITCNDCGHQSERSVTRCRKCGRRLHRSALQKLGVRFFGKSMKPSLTAVLLFIAGVAIAFGIIVFVAELRLPRF